MPMSDAVMKPTIYALSSAPGRAGVAVVRVSGPAAGGVADAIAGPRPEPRRAALRSLRDPATGHVIDRGLVVWLPAPASFTGEDTLEIMPHGSRAVLSALFAAIGRFPSTRLAEAGEFAACAFENGRLDLTMAEGLADLIDAETEAQRRQALAQADGALARLYRDWRERMLGAQALVEAAIDFADEGDVGARAEADALAALRPLAESLKAHLAAAHRGEIVREGFKVALAGPVNVGKSSLLNALARREVAIVSPEAGTTRDVLEVRLDLGGYAVIVSDTAGLRATESAVEREGIRRARERFAAADLVLWLGEAGQAAPRPDLGPPPDRILEIATKADLIPRTSGAAKVGDGRLRISAMTGEGLAALETEIGRRAAEAAESGDRGAGNPAPSNIRQREGLSRALRHLEAAAAEGRVPLEVRAEDIRLAAKALGRLTGEIDAEDVLGAIFSRFCIGK